MLRYHYLQCLGWLLFFCIAMTGHGRQPGSPFPNLGLSPVTLTFFKGQHLTEQHNLLQWQTAQEVNADYFIVEKSNDGLTFIHYAKIDAQGSTELVTNYEFEDTEWRGMNYYRLKQVDFDGTFYYSSVISIETPWVALSSTNPFQNQLVLHTIPQGDWLWCVFSTSGICLDKGRETYENKTLTLNTQKWPIGGYFIEIRSGNHVWVKRLVKK